MSLPPLTFGAWLRQDLVENALRSLPAVRSVLEIGAGGGALGARLARRYEYVGVEPDPASCARARERLARAGRGTVVCGYLSALPPEAAFDLVCAFEVLEHIEDDAGALAEWRERLHPGGSLLLSVPAHERRFGAADRLVGHVRRYDRAQMAALLARSGFADVRLRTYGFPLGYGLELGRNVLARRARPPSSAAMGTAASGRWLQPPERAAWLTQAATAPFRLVQRPFADGDRGTGFVVVAVRDD